MKNHRTVLTLAMAASLALSASASAQVVGVDLSTGDILIDQHIGHQDQLDRNTFLDRLINEFGGTRAYYLDLLDERQITQAEVYYACSIGAISQVACATIIDQRLETRSQGKGWGALAQRYGIKPGSGQFHALKHRITKAHGHDGHAMANDNAASSGRHLEREEMRGAMDKGKHAKPKKQDKVKGCVRVACRSLDE